MEGLVNILIFDNMTASTKEVFSCEKKNYTSEWFKIGIITENLIHSIIT